LEFPKEVYSSCVMMATNHSTDTVIISTYRSIQMFDIYGDIRQHLTPSTDLS
jgi:hypothetical protein